MSYPTDIHSPAASAPATTGKVAKCKVCGVTWQVRSWATPPTDTQGCTFCGADESAIIVTKEET